MKPTVCLQCHMDMVVQKDDDVSINFDTDPLVPRIVDGYLRATGTSLGADNGIGIAACFAILEDNSIKHGPLEVLVTRDEETGMYGATDLEPGILKASYMINVDSEEENAICIGCAGGFTVSMTLPLPREPLPAATHLSLVLNNFVGGHTGADIHLGRANPLHVLGRLLSASPCEVRLVSVACGTADNAIPRKCVAEVAVAAADAARFTAAMEGEFAHFHKEYQRIETKASLTMTTTAATQQPASAAATRSFVGFLEVCPYAVQRYSPVEPDAVETSMTCAIASSDAQRVTFVASVRSSSNSQMDMMYNKLRCVCDMAGLALSPKKAPYPGWEPKPDSPLTRALIQAYQQTVGVTPRVYAIHAGLECGLFMEKYPQLDCSSIGPELNFPHSPDERLKISSVAPFYRVLTSALENLANSPVCSHSFPCPWCIRSVSPCALA